LTNVNEKRVDVGLGNQDRMAEAEVCLVLALFLIKNGLVSSDVSVALDGAQIKTGDTIHFPIHEFLQKNNCEKVSGSSQGWQGVYKIGNFNHSMIIHSNPGKGDVVTRLSSGNVLRVECKKGPLVRIKGSQEYPLVREALGQLLTIEEVNTNDRLAVAVPNSPKFKELTSNWRNAPLIRRLQIEFLLVSSNGAVNGLDDLF
jgi:hypothetical protein